MSTIQEIKDRSKSFTYFKQETDYTCGPACARMMLAKFGIESFEQDLEKLMGCLPGQGTHPNSFQAVCDKYSLDLMKGSDNPGVEQLTYLDGLARDGWVVMLAYTLDVPHFSIFVGHNGQHVILCDPWRGPHVGEMLKKFWRSWHVSPEDYDKWPGLHLDPTTKSSGLWMAFKPKRV